MMVSFGYLGGAGPMPGRLQEPIFRNIRFAGVKRFTLRQFFEKRAGKTSHL